MLITYHNVLITLSWCVTWELPALILEQLASVFCYTAILQKNINEIIKIINVSYNYNWFFLSENLDLNSDFNDNNINLQEQADEQLHWEQIKQTDSTSSSHMLSSDENVMLMSEFMNLLMFFILEKTSEFSFNKILESDSLFISNLISAKNKKKC